MDKQIDEFIEFIGRIIYKQEQLDPEVERILRENLWDLYEGEENGKRED